jgi:hypothetical protein
MNTHTHLSNCSSQHIVNIYIYINTKSEREERIQKEVQ